MTQGSISPTLEEIYSLKEVDVKTIRPFSTTLSSSEMHFKAIDTPSLESKMKQWISSRLGLASAKECQEWLEEMNVGRTIFPSQFLISWDIDQYALDAEHASLASRAVSIAHTYFYKRGMSYSFSQLIAWVEQEEARSWFGYPEGFVQTVLNRSSEFIIRKNHFHNLSVQKK